MTITTTITALPDAPTRSDPSNFNDRADTFLTAMVPLPTEVNAWADEANALASQINAGLIGLSGTSTTSTTVGTGSKTLTTQTGLNFTLGMWVNIARTSDPSNTYLYGAVTSYNSVSGELVVDVKTINGSGTFTDWTISLSAVIPDAATQAEMEAGTNAVLKLMSPLNIAQAISAQVIINQTAFRAF